MELKSLRERYEALCAADGVANETIEKIESVLRVRFPSDFLAIATFFRGGKTLGGVCLNLIEDHGPADNIVDATQRIRAAIDLPPSIVVLAELDESIIVFDTAPAIGNPAIVWCDNHDVLRLPNITSLDSPSIWESFESFFESLLSNEESDRGRPVQQ